MQSTFGMTRLDYKRERARGPVSRAYLNNAIRIVDNSGVVTKLIEWRYARLKSNAGVKPTIPFRAVLVLFLLHVQLGYGINYHRIAETLDVHFHDEEFALLGIQNHAGDHDDWYQRLWRSANRMMALIDPYPGPRNKRLKPKAYAKLLTKQATPKATRKSARNLERLDWLCEQLLHTSVRMLPADIWAKYTGNIAADATLIPGTGRPNPTDPTLRRGAAMPTPTPDATGAKAATAAWVPKPIRPATNSKSASWSGTSPARTCCSPHSSPPSVFTGREKSSGTAQSSSTPTNASASPAA